MTRSPFARAAALAASAEAAFELGKSLEAATVFDLWHQLHTGRVGNQPKDASDLLVRGFGVALRTSNSKGQDNAGQQQ